MSLPRCGHGSEVLVVAVSSVHCLSEQVWVNSFRLWFPLGNLSPLRPRARCFYLLVVFPGSWPLWCSAPQCPCRWSVLSECVRDHKIIFLLVLKSSHDSFSMFKWYSISSWHFSCGQKPFRKRMKGTKFTECKFWQNRCSVENHYLHVENKKHWIICTSALMIVLFILIPSRNTIELIDKLARMTSSLQVVTE